MTPPPTGPELKLSELRQMWKDAKLLYFVLGSAHRDVFRYKVWRVLDQQEIATLRAQLAHEQAISVSYLSDAVHAAERAEAAEQQIAALLAKLEYQEPEKFAAKAIRVFVAKVNARAEADMLAGRSITGAHHRALEAELQVLATGGHQG